MHAGRLRDVALPPPVTANEQVPWKRADEVPMSIEGGRARDKTLNMVGKLPAQGPDMKVLTKGPAYARRHAV